MADAIDLLKQLQQLDAELFRLRRQQAETPRELARLDEALAGEQSKVAAAEQRIKTLQLAQKDKEGELQAGEANVRKLQSQLFQLKTNREYTTMQHEIEAQKADNSLREEAILKAFDEIDAAAKERQRAQQTLAETTARLQGDRSRIEQALSQLTDRLADLERQRKLLTPEIPPEWLTAYERILGIREGVALVPVMDNACGGCHRRLPPQVINSVLLKAKLVACESCNRILYSDEAHSRL